MVRRTRLPNPPLPGEFILAGGYKRCSTREQIEGYGLDVQDDVLRAWEAEAPNRKLVEVFADEGVSGALEIRAGMQQLEDFANAGRINRIVVPRVDRIGRTARASYNWAWRMKDVGVHFIAIAERIDTSDPLGWTMFQQYVFFAELEWNRLRERTQSGREKKIQYGGWPGGPPPFGYQIEGKGNRGSFLVVQEDEARTLLKAVNLLVDGGLNIAEAARELNRLGLLTRSGKPWTDTNLHRRLHSETLDGYTTYRKTNRGEGENTTRLYEDGTPVYGEPVKMPVPCILTPDRTQALKEAMARTAFKRGRRGDRPYPLTGRIVGEHGGTYVGGGRPDGRYYKCKGGIYLPAEPVEAATWRSVSRELRDEERLIALTSEWLASVPGDREKYLVREKELSASITKQQRLIEVRVPEYIKAGMEPAVVTAAVAKLKEEVDAWDTQLYEVRRWLAEHDQVKTRADNILTLARETRKRLDNPPLEVQEEVFELFNIQVHAADRGFVRKPGARCAVTQWHLEAGVPAPAEVDEERWERVKDLLRDKGVRFDGKTPVDERELFNMCSQRLRDGLSWSQVPGAPGTPQRARERQLQWWKRGLWPDMVRLLERFGDGTPVPRPMVIPKLHIVGQIRTGTLALQGEGGPPSRAVHSPPTRTGLSKPVPPGGGLRLISTAA